MQFDYVKHDKIKAKIANVAQEIEQVACDITPIDEEVAGALEFYNTMSTVYLDSLAKKLKKFNNNANKRLSKFLYQLQQIDTKSPSLTQDVQQEHDVAFRRIVKLKSNHLEHLRYGMHRLEIWKKVLEAERAVDAMIEEAGSTREAIEAAGVKAQKDLEQCKTAVSNLLTTNSNAIPIPQDISEALQEDKKKIEAVAARVTQTIAAWTTIAKDVTELKSIEKTLQEQLHKVDAALADPETQATSLTELLGDVSKTQALTAIAITSYLNKYKQQDNAWVGVVSGLASAAATGWAQWWSGSPQQQPPKSDGLPSRLQKKITESLHSVQTCQGQLLTKSQELKKLANEKLQKANIGLENGINPIEAGIAKIKSILANIDSPTVTHAQLLDLAIKLESEIGGGKKKVEDLNKQLAEVQALARVFGTAPSKPSVQQKLLEKNSERISKLDRDFKELEIQPAELRKLAAERQAREKVVLDLIEKFEQNIYTIAVDLQSDKNQTAESLQDIAERVTKSTTDFFGNFKQYRTSDLDPNVEQKLNDVLRTQRDVEQQLAESRDRLRKKIAEQRKAEAEVKAAQPKDKKDASAVGHPPAWAQGKDTSSKMVEISVTAPAQPQQSATTASRVIELSLSKTGAEWSWKLQNKSSAGPTWTGTRKIGDASKPPAMLSGVQDLDRLSKELDSQKLSAEAQNDQSTAGLLSAIKSSGNPPTITLRIRVKRNADDPTAELADAVKIAIEAIERACNDMKLQPEAAVSQQASP